LQLRHPPPQGRGFSPVANLVDLSEDEQPPPPLHFPRQAFGLPVVGTGRPLAAPQLCHHLAQVLRRQPHPAHVGRHLGLQQLRTDHPLRTGLPAATLSSGAAHVAIAILPLDDAGAAQHRSAAGVADGHTGQRIRLPAEGPLRNVRLTPTQGLLDPGEQGSVHDGRVLPPCHAAAAATGVVGHLARVGHVDEDLAHAQPVHRVALAAAQADLARPVGHVPEGVRAGGIADEGLADERRYGVIQDDSAGLVVPPVAEGQRPDQLALARLLRDPRLDALRDHLSLELRHRTKEAAHHAASRRAGVDRLLDGDDADLQGLEAVADVQEVAQVAGQAVQLPEDDPLETTGAGVCQETGKLLAPAHALAAATGVGVDLHQLPALSLAVGSDSLLLSGEAVALAGLLLCGHPDVAGGGDHSSDSSSPCADSTSPIRVLPAFRVSACSTMSARILTSAWLTTVLAPLMEPVPLPSQGRKPSILRSAITLLPPDLLLLSA
jgi:hypothetical protein